MEINYNGYPVFKGLQKPLEFMGIRGRFLTLAAIVIGVSFLSFLLFSIIFGKLAGFIAMLATIAVGLVTIYMKQRNGLHNKKRHKGVYFFTICTFRALKKTAHGYYRLFSRDLSMWRFRSHVWPSASWDIFHEAFQSMILLSGRTDLKVPSLCLYSCKLPAGI